MKSQRSAAGTSHAEDDASPPQGGTDNREGNTAHWTDTKKLLAGLAVATAFALPVEAANLRMAWAQDATGLDPHKQTAFSSLRLLELIYEPLVRLSPTLEVVPRHRRQLGILR